MTHGEKVLLDPRRTNPHQYFWEFLPSQGGGRQKRGANKGAEGAKWGNKSQGGSLKSVCVWGGVGGGG